MTTVRCWTQAALVKNRELEILDWLNNHIGNLHAPQVNKSSCGNKTHPKNSWTCCHFVRLASLRFRLFSASPRKKIFNTLVWVSAPISASVRPGEIHENVPLANLDSSIIWWAALLFFTNLFLLFHSNDIEDCRPEVIWKSIGRPP